MSQVRVSGFSIALDGYGAGPAQSEQHPLGIRGDELHEWMFPPPTFKATDPIATSVEPMVAMRSE